MPAPIPGPSPKNRGRERHSKRVRSLFLCNDAATYRHLRQRQECAGCSEPVPPLLFLGEGVRGRAGRPVGEGLKEILLMTALFCRIGFVPALALILQGGKATDTMLNSHSAGIVIW